MYDSSNYSTPIPDLTNSQYEALSEYTQRHQKAPDKLAPHPCLAARVLAHDKPGACFDPVTGVVPTGYTDHDEYLPDVFERMGLHIRQIKGSPRWYVAQTEWRLDILPTTATFTDAFHRRCGIFFGYPQDAIEHFIDNYGTLKATSCDIARSGLIPPEEMAYLIFITYSHERTMEKYYELIGKGKKIRRRITELADAWEMPELDEHAQAVYEDVASVYAGDGGTFTPPSVFPPDAEITVRDVKSLLS